MVEARRIGLSNIAAQKLQAHDHSRAALMVARRMGGASCSEHLKDGDLLLEVDGKTVATFRSNHT